MPDKLDRLTEQPTIDYPKDYNPELNGINGWLLFVVLGEVLMIVSGINNILRYMRYFGISNRADIRLAIVFAVIAIVYIAGSMWIVILLYKRKILFRKLFVIQTIIILVFYMLALIFLDKLSDTGSLIEAANILIRGAIWVTYLYKSKRVRNTYIYPLKYPEKKESIIS